MPARVHALLVVRPEGRVAADIHLQRTLTALRAQSRPVDALTIVLCDADGALQAVAAASDAEAVISADRRTGFAEALALASHRLDGDAVWVLAHDCAPEPDALAGLARALETAPSVAFAAPKLVRAEEKDRIVSLGVSMTRLGRTVGLADGEHDQGQHDAIEDVLGADVRGILVRSEAWRGLGGLDRALAGADEGLDLGVRARLRGGRVVLAPTALVTIASHEPTPLRTAYATRTAQLHRRLSYAPAPAVLLHWLSLLPLAVVRTLAALLEKRPVRILPEWAAAVRVLLRPAAVARTRRGIRRGRATSWARLAPLRVTGRDLRERLDDTTPTGSARGELHFFTGGGAWVVLGALVTSVVAFLSLLTWPVLGGGALAPLRAALGTLWADATYGLRPLGWETIGPADPFGAVIAVLGSLSPAAPSRAVVVLWLLAMPLAALGAWFAATRFTDRAMVRAVVAVGWALAPSLLDALVTGRPPVVIAHLLLPWLLWTATVAHRSWSAAGVASILAAGVLACAPSLAPALVLVWVIALVLTASRNRGRGLARVLWLVVPTAVVFAPLVWARVRAGDPWAVFADPGVPLADPSGGGLVRRMHLALGFPGADGWAMLVGPQVAAWTPLLVAPLLVLAVTAPIVGRTLPAAVLAITALAALATASVTIGVALASNGDTAVTLWPGAALGLYWLAALCAAALALDALPAGLRLRAPLAALVLAGLALSSLPALTAMMRGQSVLTEATSSTLPAYVEAEGRDTRTTATFVLTPTADGSVVTDVVWGSTASLGGQSTLRSARQGPDAGDELSSRYAAALIADPDGPVVSDLAAHGVAYVLLSDKNTDGTDAAGGMRLQAETSLDQRNDLEIVGDTARGKLWRVTATVEPRVAVDVGEAWRIALVQAGVVLAALLLALPTRGSLAAARRRPRIVGLPATPRRTRAPRARGPEPVAADEAPAPSDPATPPDPEHDGGSR